MCHNPTENRRKYNSMKNIAKKAVSNTMRVQVVEAHTKLKFFQIGCLD